MIVKLFRRHSEPRGQRAALLALCLLLTLSLALGQAAAGLTAPGAAAATHADSLRAQVAAAGWVTVRVEMGAPERAAADDLEQAAQDLLFTLPAGSYDTVERAASAASLTLRVDAAGLDALLGSPWAAAVTANGTPEMQRLAAGDYHGLAIKTDGGLWAWGSNNAGQLGDGTTSDRWTPVQVLAGVAAVSARWLHTLALKTNGNLWAWGYNRYGQLGDGTTTDRSTPVQILTGVAAVAATSSYHTLAIKTDGSLWAWGLNDHGQLGDGTSSNRSTPVQVLTGVTAVSGGADHSLALKTDGSLWAWGGNDRGQLGDGTTTERLSPVPVVGFGGSSISNADFTFTNITLNPSGPLAGGTFNASITVKNRGTQAGSPGLLRVWNNQPATQDCDAPGDAEISLANLAAGAKQTVSIRLPAGTAGYKTLRTFIDSQCQLTEPDETNNQVVKGYRVFAQPVADFAVTAIDLTPNRPTAGGTFSAAVTVKNRGTAPGDAGTLALWVDQPDVPACGAAGDTAVAVGTLAAGASRTLTLDGLPAGAAAAKSLRAFIDHTCVSTEAYDANNQLVKPYTVVP
jgi:hypothetical protein